MMKRAATWGVLGLLTLGSASAAVVTGRNTLLGGGGPIPGNQELRIDYSGTNQFLNGFLFTSVDADTFEVTNVTLATLFAIYLVNEGDSFTPAFAMGSAGLASNDPSLVPNFGIGNRFDIPIGQSIFLGIYSDAGTPSNIPSFGDEFGWIKISNNGSALTDLGSATALNTGGIIIGTTTAIPEPGVALFLPAVLAFFRRRR